MTLTEIKILASDISKFGVISAPDKLTGNANDNKKVFDRLIQNVVSVQFNALVDALISMGVQQLTQSEDCRYLRLNSAGALEVSADAKAWTEVKLSVPPGSVFYGQEQSLTEEEKARARKNIGAASTEEVKTAVGALLPKGGETNQVLAKASETEGDYKWVSVSGNGGGGAGLTISKTKPVGWPCLWFRTDSEETVVPDDGDENTVQVLLDLASAGSSPIKVSIDGTMYDVENISAGTEAGNTDYSVVIN